MTQRPRKHWGQHFLHDRHAIGRMLDRIAPSGDDHILEIGPGEGVLTRHLLDSAGGLDVVEIDPNLATRLAQMPDPQGKLRIHRGDILAFDLTTLEHDGPLRVVGNLPYNISTPILFHLLAQRTRLHDMHLMLQREVVARMAAAAGARERGRLSVMLQAFCDIEPLFHIPPGAFRPPPKVDSTVVRLTPLATAQVDEQVTETFAQLARLAFGGRRKTLRRTLAPMLDAAAITACGVDPGLRPERLTVADFATLARAAGPARGAG